MLKMIDTLPDILKKRKIFIWEVNRNSMAVLAELAFRGISIEGFLTKKNNILGKFISTDRF